MNLLAEYDLLFYLLLTIQKQYLRGDGAKSNYYKV